MAEIVPQEHGGAVNRFQKGESGNLNGRPKKIYTVLKESGYTKDGIRDAFSEMGWQILKVIAKAFLRGAERGDFRYVSEILQHVVGKPKETVEQTITEFKVTLNLNG